MSDVLAQRSDGKWYPARPEPYKRRRLLIARMWNWVWGGDTKKWHSEEEDRTMRECNCVVYCPECREILNNGKHYGEETASGLIHYTCSRCQAETYWDFGTPAPIIIKKVLR